MYLPFFYGLKQAGLPVGLGDFLAFLDALKADIALFDSDGFYFLARTTLVKDERHFDRFDQVFKACFAHVLPAEESGAEGLSPLTLPEDWLRRLAEKYLSDDEKRTIEALGGFEKLMQTLAERLAEQKARHQGGNKWIGTAGTSPFGAYGYNPEGVRIGQDGSRHRRAVKVWDRRDYRNLDDGVEIGTRNIKVAIRRLRRWVRSGEASEFDLDGTIRATAERGYLDIHTRPERRNGVKLLMFFDIGGSMDDHVRIAEELFSAVRMEFRHMEHFYFHNCLYEHVWKDNRRRHAEKIATHDLLRRYGPDYRVILVGDAAMSPYEITMPGGSVEHWNAEAGSVWVSRLTNHFRRLVWLNPVKQDYWDWSHSTRLIQNLTGGRMFPLTLGGLNLAMRELSR